MTPLESAAIAFYLIGGGTVLLFLVGLTRLIEKGVNRYFALMDLEELD